MFDHLRGLATSINDRMKGKKTAPGAGASSSTGKDPPPQAGRVNCAYHSRTTGVAFTWEVSGDVMLPTVLQRRAAEEEADGFAEAVLANPDNAALHARLAQALQDLEATRAAVLTLEVEWGFRPRRSRRHSLKIVDRSLVQMRVIVMEI
jgi:citrate lyase beta subunit